MASEHTGGWRTMESAPKDGRNFIAYDPRCGLLFTMHWDEEDQHFMTDTERWSGRFTHWMPLPDPPAALSLTAGETA